MSAEDEKIQLEAYVFRQLVEHLRVNSDSVQNIDLMNLAGFCRNCLAKWYKKGSDEMGQTLSLDEAREVIYGEPYETWKAKHQIPASAESLSAEVSGEAPKPTHANC